LVEGEVTRYELPNLMALNFVLKKALGGGGTKTLRFDTIGRSMASALLEMEIELADGVTGEWGYPPNLLSPPVSQR